MEFVGVQSPLALLRAIIRILPFVASNFEKVEGLEPPFVAAFGFATEVFSDSLSDKMWLCACLGAFSAESIRGCKVCRAIMESVRRAGLHDFIYTTLEEVMEVQ